MNFSASKNCLHIACAPLSALFFALSLASCAGNGQPLTESDPQQSADESGYTESYFDDSPSTGSGTSKKSAHRQSHSAGSYDSDGFSFKLPGGDWAIVGEDGVHESGVPYEFYNASTGRRAVLVEIELPKGEPLKLMDRAQMEMQTYEASGKKATLAETYPEAAFGVTGAFFAVAGKRYETPYEAVGLVTGAGNRIYSLSLSATDVTLPAGALKDEWKEFFAGFELKDIPEEEGPELSPERVQQYESTALGYKWSTKDTLWHFWSGIARQNDDPDLVLSNKAEDISLFVYGAMVPSEEVNQQDMFKVLLVKLGVDPNEPTLETQRTKVGDRYAQEFTLTHTVNKFDFYYKGFTLTHTVNKFDFYYKGRYFYDNGRGILIATWTQGINKKKYSKIMDNAVEGLAVGAKPEQATDAESAKKQAKFNAAVMSQVGILRLLENQPLVALSYFERANKMDPEEPLYLINCGFVYQMKELYGPGISYFTSQMELVRKNGKLLSILGEMYEALFDYGHARECAEGALRYTPNNPEYVINLSDALWGLGQRHQSLVVVQRLYDRQPSSRLGVYLARLPREDLHGT